MSDPKSFSEKQTLNVTQFYGARCKTTLTSKFKESENANVKKKPLPPRLNNLLGPTQIWKVFKKQNDALEFANMKRNGVITFAFQQWDGTRLFLVAHPQIFWHYDVQKTQAERCSYEIIPEASACKLYFDIEFDYELNPDKNGQVLIETFISVVLFFLSELLAIKAFRKDILNLDSSTHTKFSRHLIFVLDSHVFANNKSVGSFVHFICQKLKLYLTPEGSKGSNDLYPCDQTLICRCCQLTGSNSCCVSNIGIPKKELELLLVSDRQGKKVLICDEAVYSKNRHFRIYQNTKWKKNSPLLLSEDNLYKPLSAEENNSELLFLDSLISHIRFLDKSGKDVQIIHNKNFLPTSGLVYECNEDKGVIGMMPGSSDSNNLQSLRTNLQTSPFPEVDKFINSLVFPGHIWRSAYFSVSSVIVYDIVGYRFCKNIGRQHRSNNVKYIVNLNYYTFYQKCYDSDCSTYRSQATALPPELTFKLEDDCELVESLTDVEPFDISDSDLMEVASVLEDLSDLPNHHF